METHENWRTRPGGLGTRVAGDGYCRGCSVGRSGGSSGIPVGCWVVAAGCASGFRPVQTILFWDTQEAESEVDGAKAQIAVINKSDDLTKFGIRYYDPTLGRFTQPDPTGQDPHYTYARNNPCNYTDPCGAHSLSDITGSCAFAVAGFGVATVGAVAGIASIPATGPFGAAAAIGAGASIIGHGGAAAAVAGSCFD